MRKKSLNKREYVGFSLIELLVAISVFTLIAGTVAIFSIDTLNYTFNDRERVEAALYAQEVSNAIVINKSDLWQSIADQTGAGSKSIQFINNSYEIIDGTSSRDGVTVGFEVQEVQRDINGNIVVSGGTVDPYSRRILITATWEDFLGNNNSLSNEIYVNNWNVKKWIETSKAEFDLGIENDTYVRDIPTGDGEVELDEIFYPDWCNPSLSLNQYDIPGSASATTVFAQTGGAYLGTAGNSNGISVTRLAISGVDPPVVQVNEEYDNYLVNQIFVVGNYAYLATTSDTKEVVILDISVEPFVEVGNYNAGGSSDAYSVWVDSRGVGYVGQGRKVETFDVGYTAGNPGSAAANSGSRTMFDNINVVWLFGVVSHVIVRDTYLYAALNNDWYELAIIDVNNPSNISITSQTTVNNQQVWDLYMSEDGNRAYFGTNSSSSEREFFILNTTQKTGSRPIIGSYDTNGMTVRGISVVPADQRVVLVGTNGEEYQALNVANEANPVKCGGMQINSGIYDIDSINDVEGNAFSYLMTGDTTSEFKILRGGPGGGGGDGYGYVTAGDFTSAVFDTELADPYYFAISWSSQLPALTQIQIQVRAGDSPNLSGVPWYGPTGTGSYFTNPATGFPLPSDIQYKRYFQYKAYLTTSDVYSTPAFEEFTLFYEGL